MLCWCVSLLLLLSDLGSKQRIATQVATQQLQIRKADTDAEANNVKMRSLQAELQVSYKALSH